MHALIGFETTGCDLLGPVPSFKLARLPKSRLNF